MAFIAKIVSKRQKVFKTNLRDIVGMTCVIKKTIPERARYRGIIILNIESEKNWKSMRFHIIIHR